MDKFLPKALASSADSIILDLEDSVAARDKDDARRAVGAWLASRPDVGGKEVVVRVNGAAAIEDLAAVLGGRAGRRAWAAGVQALDGVYTDVRDAAGLRNEAGDAAAMGFDGKMCLHPDQLAPTHAAFAVPAAARARAARRRARARLYLEDLAVGRVVEHALTRTVTETDNVLATTLSLNPAQLHLDHDAAAKTEFGRPLVNSMFTLSLLVGISVHETTHGTTVANLGFDDVTFPKPMFHGDTLSARTTVVSNRPSKKRPHRASSSSSTAASPARPSPPPAAPPS
ncbi:MaoC like domain containing protein [Aureococcus anophagefferens]|nr:MaoC like domain containing protein [Aureococcus anophagefferens]